MALQIPGYRIIRKINQGGMSTVYLAIQISVGRIVALKVMNPSLTADPAFSERFQREATIVGQLSHPNIVAIYDIGRADDLNYIAMDYLPGGSVHDKMINGLTSEEAIRVTREIAKALDHAHEKGYIHRDIKPENILFRADNSAVLSDFGVAKGGIGISRMTHVGTVVGTPQYMSPEQTRGQTVDARSDLYSLGVVFYEMLTGSLPYQGEDAVTIALKHISAPIPKLPLQFHIYQKILEKFLAKDPNERFQSGREVISAIEELEAAARSPYITNSLPENLSVMALMRALVAASFNAIRWRVRKLLNWHWSKDKGFYQQTNNSSSIFSNEVAPTVFATRIQQQTAINPLQKVGRSYKLVALILLAASMILWGIMFNFAGKPPVKQQPSPAAAPQHVATTQSSSTALVEPSSSSSSAISSQAASEAPPPAYALNIKVSPANARIRLLNIPDKYRDGIELIAGRYHLEISKEGFVTKNEWVEIKNQPLTLNFQLEEAPPETIKDGKPLMVSGGKNAPEMVRIPAGSFMMGDNSNMHSAPAHKVTFSKAFAISKYEISFAEYDLYAQAANQPLPGDNGWGRDNRPVIHVNWEDARAYTQWLSKTTGKKYRLPTEAEWEYVARAGSTTHFWWGDSEQDAKGKANCRRGCYSSFSGLFGSKTAPVGSYAANPFGVYDTAGNVSEWVMDCYQDNYNNASANGAAIDQKSCAGRVVRGGSTKDNVQRLSSSARDDVPAGYLSETLGFRVVMELN